MRWVLPEDGIVDEIAVAIAASGQRRVVLTRTERLFAAALILARGGGAGQVARHLHVSSATARTLIGAVTASRAGLGEAA